MSNHQPQPIRLKEAAEAIGVAPVTLKRWLLGGRIEDVGRDRNGWRVFLPEDIERLKRFALIESSRPKGARRAKLSMASFFSGIGGFDLGFDRAGFRTTFQCEIEPFCQSILTKHWPTVPKETDIKQIDGTAIPVSDVWTGGFPCQDVSLARMGKRDGLRGKQSSLFFEFARLVGEHKPRVLLLENVAGLLSSHQGHDFEVVIHTLAELGYSVGWRTLNSKNFGVPQSRQRVYIVGCYQDWQGPSAILFEPERGQRDFAKSGEGEAQSPPSFQDLTGDPVKGPVIQSLAYCLYASSARHTGTDWSRNYVCYPKRGAIRRLVPEECEGVMAFPPGWTVPSEPVGPSEDLYSKRYYALGNAVTPPVAEWLANRIKRYLSDKVEGTSPRTAVH
jgi:DNA (cytosine-5)-methyltransferase 1